MESQKPNALIKDEKAEALVTKKSFDFSQVRQIPLSEFEKITLILRSMEFDRFASDFLRRHPESIVVHIGCDLDSRFDRVDYGQVEWYDLDLPEVIELRQEFIGDEGRRYHLLGYSALDNTWLEAVCAHQPGTFIFLAEGVFMYLEEKQVKSLVLTLRKHFPGAELVFDAFSPTHVWKSNLKWSRTKFYARFRWGIWRGKEIEGWGDPSTSLRAGGIRLLDEWGYLDWPEPRSAKIRWMRYIPFATIAGRFFHFQLGYAEC